LSFPLSCERVSAELPVSVETRACGEQIVRSTVNLDVQDRCISERLFRWAKLTPARIFIAERDGRGEWRRLDYTTAAASVVRLAGHLLAYGLSADRPLVILSRNSIPHALVTLAALHAGIPFCALPSHLYLKPNGAALGTVLQALTPGLIYFDKEAAEASAAGMTLYSDAEVITSMSADHLASTEPPETASEAQNARIDPSTIAKFLLTSGTTGEPKLVIQTHGMMLANQAMLAHAFPFLERQPPVLVDWLPWSHAFGSNHNFGLALHHGGSFYIDGGRPTPAGMEQTLANLRDVSPTVYFNVPSGFDLLLPHIRNDQALAERFFERLQMLFYGAASLTAATREGFDKASMKAIARVVPFLTGYGATETAPAALIRVRDGGPCGSVGLPLPGTAVKLVPYADTFEARVKGRAVTPGYWRNSEATHAAFDEDGYFRIGDALRWIDDKDPGQGLCFDGRIADDFKLANGEWVRTGRLSEILQAALGGLAKHVVIVGQDRPFVAALISPDYDAGLTGEALAAEIQKCFAFISWDEPGTCRKVRRLLILPMALSLADGELTEKGSVNSRAVQLTRAREIDLLYQQGAFPPVINLADT
jgi:feruloyl-CoA synthase